MNLDRVSSFIVRFIASFLFLIYLAPVIQRGLLIWFWFASFRSPYIRRFSAYSFQFFIAQSIGSFHVRMWTFLNHLSSSSLLAISSLLRQYFFLSHLLRFPPSFGSEHFSITSDTIGSSVFAYCLVEIHFLSSSLCSIFISRRGSRTLYHSSQIDKNLDLSCSYDSIFNICSKVSPTVWASEIDWLLFIVSRQNGIWWPMQHNLSAVVISPSLILSTTSWQETSVSGELPLNRNNLHASRDNDDVINSVPCSGEFPSANLDFDSYFARTFANWITFSDFKACSMQLERCVESSSHWFIGLVGWFTSSRSKASPRFSW